jgi:hypothetical protein
LAPSRAVLFINVLLRRWPPTSLIVAVAVVINIIIFSSSKVATEAKLSSLPLSRTNGRTDGRTDGRRGRNRIKVYCCAHTSSLRQSRKFCCVSAWPELRVGKQFTALAFGALSLMTPFLLLAEENIREPTIRQFTQTCEEQNGQLVHL